MTTDTLPTPSLLVCADRLDGNLRGMAEVAGATGKRLRPHTKTHKAVELARRQVAMGAAGITVAKLAEAEVFAAAGFDDVFVANLIVGPDKLGRLGALAGRLRMSVGIDSDETLAGADRAGRDAHAVVGVLIELDTGHHRTGVRTVRAAARLASTARRLANVRLAGVYTHEGHVYKASPERIPEVCAEAADALRTAAAECETGFVSVGSTPGAVSMAGEHAVSELRPGNYVYLDATQVSLGAAAERCALTVLTTVISRPTAVDAFLDVGTKGLSGDRTPDGRCGFILGHPEAVVDWCSEEHAHLRLDATNLAPVVGDRLRVVPAHACACVNCHDRAWLLRGDEIIETWPVSARGRMT